MFEEDTLRAIAQSRSAQRRRDHASPRRTGGGGGGDPGDDEPGDDDDDIPNPPADRPAGDRPPNPAMLPQDPLADNLCIPGRSRVFPAADIDPWILDDLCRWSIMTMTVDLFATALPFRPEWIYSHHTPRSRPPSAADYCAHLITADNLEALLNESPWEILGGGNVPDPICFEILVGGRLGVFLDEYSQLELRDLIVYWESTHKLPITKRMCADDPRLTALCKARNNRRSHAGDRWHRILPIFVLAIQEGWCDLDLLLDPFFLHFPKRSDEVTWYPGIEARRAGRPDPANLIEALAECDEADPWRNHYRTSAADHPAHRIPRLVEKFFGMESARHDSPADPELPAGSSDLTDL
ncbi:hypothetical protein PHMEG_00032562 [Phytophthora megakarya]|uniref:Uncharacterized protein n=1 Tax=Phytophthora megakarya TaxID=4795 RepID=A0A225UVN7_9STRA|nr:hypothetical protein PHMEG_00032562 [Phytophthora megakarya]